MGGIPVQVAIYVRASRPEQVDAQLRACRKYAKRQGWAVKKEYEEQ